jgi:glyoxylase-like metal-dependent hydrolase (beta-lactamase superfamily II)
MKAQKITEGVYCVGSSEMTDSKDCSVYLLDLGEAVLIDSGAGTSVDRIVDNIGLCDVDSGSLSTIILTHCHIDHIGGAAELRRRFGCRIVMHDKEAVIVERGDNRMTGASWYGIDFAPLAVDVKVSGDEERLVFGNHEVVCLFTPGHSPGSMSVYTDMDGQRILFGQDIHGPFLKEFGADMKAWTVSMKKLLAVEADILCEGHFGVYRPKKEVAAYIERYLEEYGE